MQQQILKDSFEQKKIQARIDKNTKLAEGLKKELDVLQKGQAQTVMDITNAIEASAQQGRTALKNAEKVQTEHRQKTAADLQAEVDKLTSSSTDSSDHHGDSATSSSEEAAEDEDTKKKDEDTKKED